MRAIPHAKIVIRRCHAIVGFNGLIERQKKEGEKVNGSPGANIDAGKETEKTGIAGNSQK